MTRTIGFFVCFLLAFLPTATVAAAERQSDPTFVPLFAKTCLAGGLDPAAKQAAIQADRRFAESKKPIVDISEFNTVPASERFSHFAKPIEYRQWTGDVEGQSVQFVFATFAPKNRYVNLCAMIVANVDNMFPYLDGFREAIKATGLKGKSIDLPHYAEFAGKLSDGRKGRADLFTRTQVVANPRAMHMTFAY